MQIGKTVTMLLCLWLTTTASMQAQNGERVVRDFCENLRLWCATEDFDYRARAEKNCDRACRVQDRIMIDYARRKGLSIKHYVLENYMNCFEQASTSGRVNVQVGGVKTLSPRDIVFSTSSYSGSSRAMYEKQEKLRRELTFVMCSLRMSGGMNYDVEELYLVRNGKIVFICPYEKVGGKARLDMESILDAIGDNVENAYGLSYNWNKHWPLGFSLWYSSGWFTIDVDLGVKLNKHEKFVEYSLNFMNIDNFVKEKTTYTPLGFATVTPMINLNYVSVGCGVGAMLMQKDVAGTVRNAESSYTYSESGDMKFLFMFRPMIRGIINILDDEFFLTPAIAYDCIPKCKEESGLSFSIGVMWEY